MRYEVTSFRDWQIVSIAGKFVLKTVGQISKTFESLEKAGEKYIAVNLSATTHVDSSAITLLVTFFKRMRERNGKLVFFGANDDINEIFSIVGLRTTLPFYKTRQQFENSIQPIDT